MTTIMVDILKPLIITNDNLNRLNNVKLFEVFEHKSLYSTIYNY